MFDLSLFPLAVYLYFFIHKSLFVWPAVHRGFMPLCLIALVLHCAFVPRGSKIYPECYAQ
jgi:hypothetical protein